MGFGSLLACTLAVVVQGWGIPPLTRFGLTLPSFGYTGRDGQYTPEPDTWVNGVSIFRDFVLVSNGWWARHCNFQPCDGTNMTQGSVFDYWSTQPSHLSYATNATYPYYPASLFPSVHACLSVGDGADNMPAGDYVFSVDGDADFVYEGDAALVAVHDTPPNTYAATVRVAPAVGFRVCATAVRSPLSNAHLTTAADANATDLDTQPFHPLLLAHLAGASVLRLDGWMKTEVVAGSTPRLWADRPLPGTPQVFSGGVAVEYMVMLCNALGAAPWFYLPAAAGPEDAFHAGVAGLVLAGLDPALPVYYEYAHGVGFNSWDKAAAMVVKGIWEGVFGGAAHRLVHAHTTNYPPHVVNHWAEDLPEVDILAMPGSVGGPFNSRAFVHARATYTVAEAVEDMQAAVLDAEAEYNDLYHLMVAAGVQPALYQAAVVATAPRYGFRDDVTAAKACFERRRYPCPVQVWNATGGTSTLYMHNETHTVNASDAITLRGFSREVLEAEADAAADRFTANFENNWGARFTGTLVVPHTTVHVFRAVVDRGLKLFLDGAEVWSVNEALDGAVSSGPYTPPPLFITLTAGTHAFELHYWDQWRASTLQLTVSVGGPAQPQHPVNASLFTPDGIKGEWFHTFLADYNSPGRYLDSYPPELGGDAVLPSFTNTVPSLVWGPTLDALPDVAAGAAVQFVATVNASLDAGNFVEGTHLMVDLAAREQAVADAVHAAMDEPAMKEVHQEWWERLFRIGYNHTVVVGPLYYARGSHCALPNSCATAGVLHASSQAASPKLDAFRAALAGTPSTLPFTAADLAPVAPDACAPSCVWGLCGPGGTCTCFAGYTGAACDVVDPAGKPNDCNAHGVNLNGMADWSRRVVYTDVHKSARGWVVQDFTSYEWSVDDAPAIEYDANGYPTALPPNVQVGTMMIRDLDAHGISGDYTILYDGDGVLVPSMTDVKAVRRSVGKLVVTVELSTNANNGLFLSITRTNPLDPVRNIRVILPGFADTYMYDTHRFHPYFIESLAPYKALRFMDWQHANGVQPSAWADRNTRDWRSYAASTPAGHNSGVPLEDIVQVANMVGADAWLSMPYNADDDHLRRFAETVRDTLRPDVDVYVEFVGNEPWHTGFSGGEYAQQKGLEAGLDAHGVGWYGGTTNAARFCYVGNATQHGAAIWKAAWGAQASRVKVVLQSQFGWREVTPFILSCLNTSAAVDYVALAPYFGFDTTLNTTLDAVFDTHINLTATLDEFHAHKAAADAAGVGVVLYEAGWGAVGDGSSTDLGIAAALDPRMRGVYLEYYTALVNAGTHLAMQFTDVGSYSQYGSWGMKNAFDQDPAEAPKFLGYHDFLAATAEPGCTPPDDGRSCPDDCSGRGHCMPDGTCQCWFRYSGPSCADTDVLNTYDCGYRCTFDQGECVLKEAAGYRHTHGCDCVDDYFGKHCARFSCPADCSWNGECVDKDICSCYRGFKGRSCEADCGCGGHGTCTPDAVLGVETNNTCVCDAGYRFDAGAGCVPDCPCDACIGPGECACEADCIHGTCYAGQCECWAGFGGVDCTAPAPRLNNGTGVGVGPSGLAYWSTQYAFVNVFRQSSAWTSNWDSQMVEPDDARWGFGPDVALDAHGWPTRLHPHQRLTKLLMRNVRYHAPVGTYVVLYDGDGTLEFSMDASVTKRDKGRMEVYFDPTANIPCHDAFEAYCGDNGMAVTITRTNPDNPLTNVRILYPGFEATYPRRRFHPQFLKDLERFSTLRFMDLQHTNNSPDTEWDTRAVPGDDNAQLGKGVPLEHLVELANVVGAKPWFNIPHAATDDYVQQFAAYVAANLRPDVEVIVEYSNEVWASNFAANGYALQQAAATGIAADAPDDRAAVARFHSRRAVQVATLFKAAFGAGAHRVKHVLSTWGHDCGGFCGQPYTTELLGFEGAAAHVDALGITGYFCGQYGSDRRDWARIHTVEEVVAACGADAAATVSGLQWFVDAAAAAGVGIATYEAGPSLSEYSAIATGDFSPTVTHHLWAVNRHPGLQQVYVDYMNAFRAAGIPSPGFDWMHFATVGSPSQYGFWQFKEYTGQEATPKYLALMEVAEANAGLPVTPGCLSPAAGYRGAGDSVLVGAPGVLAPTAPDVWIQGSEVELRYGVLGRDPAQALVVSLYRTSNCVEYGGVKVATIAAGVRPTGVLKYRVPATTGHGGGFIVEVRDRHGANYSEPFSIEAPFFFQTAPWSPCTAACGSGVEVRQVTCHPFAPSLYDRALEQAQAAVAGVKITCPLAGDCQVIDGQGDVRNQVCTPHEGVTWPLTFVADSAWESMCYYDENRCRVYRTNWWGPTYGYSLGKLFTDCTVTWDDTPLIVQDDLEAQAQRRVNTRVCAAFDPAPAAARQCFERPCSAYAYRAGSWSECSAACGGGTRTRAVDCIDADLNVVGGGLCTDAAPPATETCNDFPCDTFSWHTGSFGACTSAVGCGAGVSRRLVVCHSSLGVPVPESNCGDPRPVSVQTCDAGACAAYAWSTAAWQACDVTCGGGTVFRDVTCVDTATGDAVDQYFCETAGVERPARSRACNSKACVTFGWAVGEWTVCPTCGKDFTRTRDVACVDSTGSVAASEASCAGQRPSSSEACPACAVCEASTCSGHGSCAAGVCTSCDAGWGGPFCGVPSSCGSGVLDGAGSCCPTGVLAGDKTCCDGVAPSTDRFGQCCGSGVLDACGVCDGTGVGLDADNVCCPAGGVFDAGGSCCPSGVLDACGVCDGDEKSCATAVVQSVVGPPLEALDPLSPEYLTFVDALTSEFAALIGVDPLYIAITGLGAVEAGPGRRLADAGGNVTVAFEVQPNGNTTSSGIEDALAVANATSTVSTSGVCGNDVCENGETCVNAVSDTCCIADCPSVILSCSSDCGGSSRGQCVSSSGVCDCFAGYTGSACGSCDFGYVESGGSCVRVDEPSPSPSPSPSPTPSSSASPTSSSSSSPTPTSSPSPTASSSPSAVVVVDASPAGSSLSLPVVLGSAVGVGLLLGAVLAVVFYKRARRGSAVQKVVKPTGSQAENVIVSPLANPVKGRPGSSSSDGSQASRASGKIYPSNRNAMQAMQVRRDEGV